MHRPPPGTPAGIEYHELVRTPGAGSALVVCTDYCPERWEEQSVADIAAFVAAHRPDWSQVRWIHVEGLGDAATIRALAEKYQLHPLAIEDVLDGQHRPKADDYPGSGDQPGRLFVVARRVVRGVDDVHAEQVNFFLGRHTLLSFQSSPCPAIEAVRRRSENPRSRLRQNDASFLLYSILDTIVDGLYPILEDASLHLEEAEESVIEHPEPATLNSIHRIKRGLILLRRVAWPMRELIGNLQRERHECLSEVTQTYFRDVYDHCVQVIDLIETYREIASDVADMHLSMLSNRTNEIMKVLTIIGTIFIPLTFIVGVYGMNMYIPENQWHYTYAVFWVVCLGIAGYMLWRFRRGGWF
ncbi:magnesium/cobalt transporter CorA [uncultured Thiodictyon sp.]|uniref:magnesium/cobalt transporter CorA n=1 Tax=uncultured Thiodictyon sp. TaxID=1846217 RepID=UPI0025F3702B|nr:magnesium/cobalt transporter CorA [uncultured Thiodictyon sp.]